MTTYGRAHEVKATASSGGKPINRENITASRETEPVTFYRTDGSPTIFCGFQQEFLSGEDPATGATFDLGSGAGLGSKYMTLTVHLPDGTTVYEFVDVTEFVQSRVRKIIAESAAPGKEPTPCPDL